MNTLIFTLLFGLLGIVIALIYTFGIGLAGATGAILSVAAAKRSPEGITPIWGLFITVAGQLYASLCFVTLVIRFVQAYSIGLTGLAKSVIWSVAFIVSTAPTAMALKDAAYARQKNIQHRATTFTTPLTFLGFFLFPFFPTIMNVGWGWVPQF